MLKACLIFLLLSFMQIFVAQTKIFSEKGIFRKCLMFRVLRQPVAYCRLADMFRLSFLHFVTC